MKNKFNTSPRCPKCKTFMNMFGVTDRGAYKYACPKCYKHIERKPNDR